MRVEPFVGEVQFKGRQADYIVRIWIPSVKPSESEMRDEWLITGTTSVMEALDWAHTRADGLPIELFVIADDDWIRIHGNEPGGGTTVAVGIYSTS
ncbi:hypothetical protein GCM10009785_02050 [Brooklawnia cerclae]|uniref:Uncharacterized protein n=1 Tax=Brooklawnia cerclae TaxID=349934 RepID=A0ABX0SHU9_9ACTN|nr:hypothetical protein [Brooklawnia cerclae]NIH56201.1 hypothetical protein [Brooklawnia cerclae]